MANGKLTIVLGGGGHKGFVKLTCLGAGVARGSCSLDFRPSGATLYLIGDGVAHVALKDINTSFEIPFEASGDVGCVVRSSSLTMFGGNLSHSEMLARIEVRGEASKPRSQSAPPPAKEKSKPPLDRETLTEVDAKISALESEAEDDEPSPPEQRPSVSIKEPLKEWTKYDGNNFYYAIKPQLDELFVCYPAEQTLNDGVQNSKWVRVDAPDGAYAVGLLYDGDEPAFICYGVPEPRAGSRPPVEIEDMCVWLPLSAYGIAGYWVIYQSARTGDIIK